MTATLHTLPEPVPEGWYTTGFGDYWRATPEGLIKLMRGLPGNYRYVGPVVLPGAVLATEGFVRGATLALACAAAELAYCGARVVK